MKTKILILLLTLVTSNAFATVDCEALFQDYHANKDSIQPEQGWTSSQWFLKQYAEQQNIELGSMQNDCNYGDLDRMEAAATNATAQTAAGTIAQQEESCTKIINGANGQGGEGTVMGRWVALKSTKNPKVQFGNGTSDDPIGSCEKFTTKSWQELATGDPKQAYTWEIWTEVQKIKQELVTQNCWEVAAAKTMKESMAQELSTCAALVALTGRANYEDEELKGANKEKSEIPMGMMMMQGQGQQANPMAMMGQMGGSQLECKSVGHITQDYPDCVAAINAYQGFFIGQMAKSTYDQMDQMDTQNDVSNDAARAAARSARSTSEDGTVDPYEQQNDLTTVALQGQKKLIDQQQDVAQRGQVFDLAKAGTFLSIINSMPDYDTLADACVDAGNTDNKFGDGTIPCKTVLDTYKGYLLKNAKGLQAAKMQLAQALMSFGRNTLASKLLGDQKDQLNALIRDFQAYNPKDKYKGPWDNAEAIVAECEAEPDSEKCRNGMFRTQGFAGGNFSFGGTGGANTTIDPNTGLPINNTGTNNNNSGPLATSDKEPEGAFIDDTPTATEEFTRGPAAGSLKRGAGGTGGGGGGGGSAGSMAAPGGKVAGADDGQKKDPALPSGNLASYRYGKGAAGSLNYSSGRRTGSSKSKASDPFADILGKNKGNGPKGQVLNMRNPASESEIGDKYGKDLFTTISETYDRMEKQKRLLEYE